MSLTIKQRIEYFERRSKEEAAAAAAAECDEARRVHELLAQQHARAAEQEREHYARCLADVI